MPHNTTARLSRLSPEIRAILGVYALYWKIEETFAEIKTDLNHPECHMLIKLDQPKRMGVLAADMLSVPSTITATAEDRRAWLLVLTQKGKDTRELLVAEAGALFHRASGLDAEETAEFARLAFKVRNNILKSGIPEGLNK